MVPFVVDVVVVMILAFFVWSGYRKGLVLSVATLVIFFLSVMIGSGFATANTESAAAHFDDLTGWIADEATENALAKFTDKSNLTDRQVSEAALGALTALGIQKDAASYLSGVVAKRFRSGTETLYENVSRVFVRSVTWVALFLFGFLIANLLMSLIANFAGTVLKLPVLRWLDAAGGIIFGLVTGILIMMIAGAAIRYLGIVPLVTELTEDTSLLKFFVNANPFGNMLTLTT